MKKIGRNLVYKSNLSKEEHIKNLSRIKENRQKLKEEINFKINKVLKLIEKYNPFTLLQKIVMENQILCLEDYQESTDSRAEIFIEYAISLIISCKKHGWDLKPSKEISEEFSKLIKEIVSDTVWYFGSEITEKNSEDQDIHLMEEIRFKTISNYIYVRGDCYESHDAEMVNDLFNKHTDFFEKHYGLSYNQIMQGILSIKQSIEDNLNAQMQVMDDFMIISPSEFIPEELLRILSTNLGNNDMFLQFNKCWPINDTIIKEKPIIKHQEKYYCFFYPILGRNIRHILEKMIKEKDENYYSEYYLKRGRDEYLENKSTKYFQDIIPQANIYQNLKYRIDNEEFETDIIVEFDRNLLIIEAKANALKLSSRRGSLVALKTDTKKTMKKAYEQALRTRKYIKGNVPAKFKEKNGNEIIFRRDDFDNIYLINVTLDNLNFLSTELADMKIFGLNKSENWFWSVYLNDLKVISELIEFPSEFLLYLQRRLDVIEQQFYSQDELDYFMFFLDQGLYFVPTDFKGVNKFIPDGYTDALDRYYFFKEGSVSSGEKPVLKISTEYKQFVKAIESTGKEYFSFITNFLLSIDKEGRDTILINIKKIYKQFNSDNKPHNFTLAYKSLNMGITSYIVNAESDLENIVDIEHYCKVKMEHMGINTWVVFKFVKTIDFNEVDFEIYFRDESNNVDIIKEVEELKKSNIKNFLAKHKKIGRNELCPCGSGDKYKKCCGKQV